MPEDIEIKTSDFDATEIEAAIAAATAPKEEVAITETAAAETVITEPVKGAETAATTETTPAVTAADYPKWLSEQTDGFIKDEATFKALFPKIKGYDELETKLKTIESQIPQFKNDESKAFFEHLTSGDTKAIADYLAEKSRDYSTMSDVEVRKLGLKMANPHYDDKAIDLKMRQLYGKSLALIDTSTITDADDLEKAEAHNAEVESKLEELALDAVDDRIKLQERQKSIELPQIKKDEPAPQQAKVLTAEEIADANKKWVKNVDDSLPKLENIKMNINDAEVEYVRTKDEVKELSEKLKSFNMLDWLKGHGCYGADNAPDVVKIAALIEKVDGFEKIQKSLAAQVRTPVVKEVLGKIKNIDGTYTPTHDAAFESLADAAEAAKKKAGWN